MDSVVILVVVIVGIAILAKVARAGGDGGEWPFYPKKPLTKPEQVLYFRLVKALPNHMVLCQVQLSRFLGVKKGSNFHKWNNRINRMSADYLVCDRGSSIVAVIELDDSSHNTKARKEADSKKNMAVGSAGIRIIRWNVRDIPSEERIVNELLPPIGPDANLREKKVEPKFEVADV